MRTRRRSSYRRRRPVLTTEMYQKNLRDLAREKPTVIGIGDHGQAFLTTERDAEALRETRSPNNYMYGYGRRTQKRRNRLKGVRKLIRK